MKRIKLLPEFIMLVAGLITCIIAVVTGMDNSEAVKALLIVLVSFYCLGFVARFIIKKICFPEKEDEIEESEEDGEEGSESEEEEQGSTKEE